jgi:large subunit ribosomal protein L9
MMEVILREDVKSLGKAGALVRVKPGYARNFLLPQGLAYEATSGNKKRIEAETKSREARAAHDKTEAQAVAATLGAIAVTITAKADVTVEQRSIRKAGEGDRLFGSITAQDIADQLALAGHPVDKRKIDLSHPIKQLGEHTVPVRLHSEVQAAVRVTVVAE